MSEKVRLGFVGCGFMDQRVHLSSLQKVKNAEIVAICDVRNKLAKAVADRWKIKKFTISSQNGRRRRDRRYRVNH